MRSRRSLAVTDFYEAVVRQESERLVPILMTALASGLALIPIAPGRAPYQKKQLRG